MRRPAYILLGIAILVAMLYSCANIGSPDGGPYDETPPRVVHSTPENGAVGANRKKITILFDEYIKLENASEKVVVSPPQTEAPNIRAVGKAVRIDLYDSLQANTTYTIDFGDAIEDNNEGNPMGQYAFSFSTGQTIDTMEVSGTVLNAQDLEPIKGITVGLQALDSTFHDSLFTTRPLIRVGRTNGSGHFSIKGVKPGRYRAYALQDMDGNFIYNQKSERIAFDTITLETSCRPDIRMDTCWRDTLHYDSIRIVPYTHFFPDNVVLRAFLEEGQDLHRLKEERATPESFTLYFTAPADSLPTLRGLDFDASCLYAEPSLHNDTITYWVTDTAYCYQQDTLTFEMRYMETDTLGVLQPKTDTLQLVPKTTRAKQMRERQKQIDDWNKDREKRLRRAKESLSAEENPYERVYLEIAVKPSGSLDPNQNVTVTANQPIDSVDMSKLHFYIYNREDSDWVPEPFLFLPDTLNRRSYVLYAEWEEKCQYRFVADSTAFVSVMGLWSKGVKQEFKVRPVDEFGSLFVHVEPLDTNLVVQLLNKSDKPIRELRVNNKGNADFYYLKPGDYYVRAYCDENGNGYWDTGNYADGVQPEMVYYMDKAVPVKAKWDVEQLWRLNSVDPTRQKPKAITKQKPDKEKSVRDRNRQREEELRRQKQRK